MVLSIQLAVYSQFVPVADRPAEAVSEAKKELSSKQETDIRLLPQDGALRASRPAPSKSRLVRDALPPEMF